MKNFLDITVLYLFIIWRIGLFAVAFSAPLFITHFNESFPYYRELLISTGLPNWIWGFANFDGVHYITIAQKGYEAQFTQAFFPLYPLAIKFFSISNSYLISGLFLSNLFFVISLYLLQKLLLNDYPKGIVYKTLIFFLSFPTAFYFGSVYTESLFLMLTLMCFLALRANNFILAGLIAALASATRIHGIFLMPVLLVEALTVFKKTNFSLKKWDLIKITLGIFISPMGLIAYMGFLKFKFNDALYFLTAQPAFGAQRSDVPLILLPQVFFRYIKILLTVTPTSFPFFTALTEIFFTVFFLLILVLSFKHVRRSYWIFSFLGFLLPTLTGTLSSMPRYVLICFLLFPFIAQLLGKFYKFSVLILILLQIIFLSFFIRGYWIA